MFLYGARCHKHRRTILRHLLMLGAAGLVLSALTVPGVAQGPKQTVTLMKVDPTTIATGYRSSKIVGSSVVNDANETVGTVNDLIVTQSEQVPYAVLSVGGFLGIGTKYVVVPFGRYS